jgi:biotin carboxylase
VVAADQRDGGPAARLLVLGAGPAQLGLLAAARNRGLHVVAVDRDPSAPGFRYADRRAIVSTEDEPGIERLAAAEQVDGIIAPGIDWPVAIAARVAARLGLPHPLSPEAAVLSTSKLRQRERFAEARIPQPRFVVCSGAEEAVAAAGELGYPCVVKAPDRQGQRGLSLVTEARRMASAVELALDASRSATLIVEEHVAGREVTVNGFSLDGRFRPLTVTDRLTADPPAFGVALAHVWPSELEPPQIAAAIEVAGAAASAVGVANGPTYTQVLVAPDGSVRVGELAARLGGGHDAELAEAATSVSLNDMAISAAFGEDVSPPRVEPRVGGAVTRFLVAPAGVLESVAVPDDLDGVLRVRIYREPGYVVPPLRHGSDRAGAVLAVGTSREEALARADAAAARIRFEVAAAGALAS